MIERIDDLKNYFFNSIDRFNDNVFVKTKLRNKWILNKETTIQRGKVCTMKFNSIGGGIWKAELESITDKQFPKETKIDTKQLRGMVSERNTYKKLLDKCVKAFNIMPNFKLNGKIKDTYTLVSTIEKNLNKFN